MLAVSCLFLGLTFMPTLVLRGVPDGLYRHLKQSAGLHRRSMTQEAIALLEAGLGQAEIPVKPSPEAAKDWLSREVWSLPVLDTRSDEAILGYGENGLGD